MKFLELSQTISTARGEGGGGGTPHMKGVGMLFVSLRGVKFRILVSLRVFWAKRHHI